MARGNTIVNRTTGRNWSSDVTAVSAADAGSRCTAGSAGELLLLLHYMLLHYRLLLHLMLLVLLDMLRKHRLLQYVVWLHLVVVVVMHHVRVACRAWYSNHGGEHH